MNFSIRIFHAICSCDCSFPGGVFLIGDSLYERRRRGGGGSFLIFVSNSFIKILHVIFLATRVSILWFFLLFQIFLRQSVFREDKKKKSRRGVFQRNTISSLRLPPPRSVRRILDVFSFFFENFLSLFSFFKDRRKNLLFLNKVFKELFSPHLPGFFFSYPFN